MRRIGFLFGFLVFANMALAQDRTLYGTLVAIDPKVGTLSLSMMQPKPLVKNFNLADMKLPVTDGLDQQVPLDSLKKNARLAVRIGKDNDDEILAIRDESNIDIGAITGIDLKKSEITTKCGYAQRVLRITPELPIVIDEQPAPINKLKATSVDLVLNPERTKVVLVRQGKGMHYGNPYCRYENQAGFLLSRDDAKKTISLITLNERYKPLELNIDAWTHVRLMYSSWTLRDAPVDLIQPYVKMSLYYESDRKRVSTIAIEVPHITRRPFEAMDAKARSITILVDDNQRESFTIAEGTMVLRDYQPIRLEQVPMKGLMTVGLSMDQKEVLFIHLHSR